MPPDTATLDPLGIAACSPTLRATIAATYRQAAACYRDQGKDADADDLERRADAWEADDVRGLADLLTAGVLP